MYMLLIRYLFLTTVLSAFLCGMIVKSHDIPAYQHTVLKGTQKINRLVSV